MDVRFDSVLDLEIIKKQVKEELEKQFICKVIHFFDLNLEKLIKLDLENQNYVCSISLDVLFYFPRIKDKEFAKVISITKNLIHVETGLTKGVIFVNKLPVHTLDLDKETITFNSKKQEKLTVGSNLLVELIEFKNLDFNKFKFIQ